MDSKIASFEVFKRHPQINTNFSQMHTNASGNLKLQTSNLKQLQHNP